MTLGGWFSTPSYPYLNIFEDLLILASWRPESLKVNLATMREQNWFYVVTKLRQCPNFCSEKGWKYLGEVDSLMIPLHVLPQMSLAFAVLTAFLVRTRRL